MPMARHPARWPAPLSGIAAIRAPHGHVEPGAITPSLTAPAFPRDLAHLPWTLHDAQPHGFGLMTHVKVAVAGIMGVSDPTAYWLLAAPATHREPRLRLLIVQMTTAATSPALANTPDTIARASRITPNAYAILSSAHRITAMKRRNTQ